MTPSCPSPVVDDVDEAYDSPGWWYNLRGFFILKLSYRDALISQVRFFARHVSPNHLEAAVGTGTLLKLVLAWRRLRRQPRARIVAFDCARRMIESARHAFRHHDQVRILLADAVQLEFPDRSFQSVSIANAFHCFHEPARVLAELHRVLAPGGTLAMNVLMDPEGWGPLRWISRRINAWGIRKGILFSPYSQEEVRRVVRSCGFELAEERRTGNAAYVVCRKTGFDA